jgi:hypothetical protein
VILLGSAILNRGLLGAKFPSLEEFVAAHETRMKIIYDSGDHK